MTKQPTPERLLVMLDEPVRVAAQRDSHVPSHQAGVDAVDRQRMNDGVDAVYGAAWSLSFLRLSILAPPKFCPCTKMPEQYAL